MKYFSEQNNIYQNKSVFSWTDTTRDLWPLVKRTFCSYFTRSHSRCDIEETKYHRKIDNCLKENLESWLPLSFVLLSFIDVFLSLLLWGTTLGLKSHTCAPVCLDRFNLDWKHTTSEVLWYPSIRYAVTPVQEMNGVSFIFSAETVWSTSEEQIVPDHSKSV